MNNYNINFKGINISNAIVCNQKLKLYKLTPKDQLYIDKLKNSISYQELNPMGNRINNSVFNAILYEGFTKSLRSDRESLLLTYNNKPCGLMVNSNSNRCHFFDYVCTWPIEVNKKAPLGAKTMFLEAFRHIQNGTKDFIQINATKCGNAITKYMSIGFKPLGNDGYTERMRITKERLPEIIKKLEEKIELTPTYDTRDLDLFEETII